MSEQEQTCPLCAFGSGALYRDGSREFNCGTIIDANGATDEEGLLCIARRRITHLEAVVAAWHELHYAKMDLDWRIADETYRGDWPEAEREHKARMELARLGQFTELMDPSDSRSAVKDPTP